MARAGFVHSDIIWTWTQVNAPRSVISAILGAKPLDTAFLAIMGMGNR